MSLQIKQGRCKGENCPNKAKMVAIRSGMCFHCANKRFHSYGRDKPKTVKHKATGEMRIFLEAWANRDHYSQIGGEYLGNIFKHIFCSHVLSKGAYSEARLHPENIFLVTEKEHLSIHNIARSDLIKQDKKWIKYFEYYDKIKHKYDEKRIKASRQASRL